MEGSTSSDGNWTSATIPEDVIADLEVDRTMLASIGAHELREPVQAVRSFLAVVLDGRTGPLNDLQEDFLTSASEATRRISRLIDDLQLILSTGQELDFRGRPLDLTERVLACCRELSQIAIGNSITLDNKVADERRRLMFGDPDRVDQILLNIIENAIQYAPAESTVLVSVDEAKDREWTVIVENDSPPDSEFQPSDWLKPFNRGGRVGGRGLGLGLTVVSMLLRLHRGTIAFSTHDRRVRATLRFPHFQATEIAQL